AVRFPPGQSTAASAASNEATMEQKASASASLKFARTRVLPFSSELFKHLRQSLRVLSGFGKARALVVPGKDQNVFPHLWIGDGRRELLRGLPRGFTHAFAVQPLQHPHVPEAGY